MDPLYTALKVVHILLAIVAVGLNVSYGIWQVRAARSPEHTGFALRGIKFMDDRIANPSYIGLLIVGVALVLIGPWRFEMLWIAASLALYATLAVVALAFYSPTLRRQIAVYESEGAASPDFAALSTRSRILGAVMGILVVAIIVLMVAKPT